MSITNDLDLALQSLRNGDIVAIPTETVYGLAGNAENETAIKKIFALKQRPLNHPLIMHVAPGCDLSRWVTNIPNYAQRLIDTFWPGPLTIVFHCKPGSVSALVTGGQKTVAIRCPQHPIAQSLLKQLDFPLVAPSANPFGKISPTTAAHVVHSFADKTLLVVDGGRCNVGIESTIIAATDATGYQILRPGMIDEAALEEVVANRVTTTTSNIRVPGKLKSHYQPEKPLYCFENIKEMKAFCHKHAGTYVLSFHKDREFNDLPGYQLPAAPSALAYELYYQLRNADHSSAVCIVMELPPAQPQWEGVRERILKAATPKN